MAQANTYPAKTTPIAGDRLMLLDSASGANDAIKLTTITQLFNSMIVDAAWTPVLSFANQTVAPILDYSRGRYLRLGNMVFVIGYMVLAVNTTNTPLANGKGTAPAGSGSIASVNLPVTVAGSMISPLPISWANMTGTFTNMQVLPSFNLASGNIYKVSAAAGGVSNVTWDDFANTSQIRFSGIYLAA